MSNEEHTVPDTGNPGEQSNGEKPATIETLRHELLVATDTILGLRAELATLQARFAVVAASDLGVALERIGNLEDERQALLDQVRRAPVSHDDDIAAMRASLTWRIGSVIVRPLSIIAGRRR
jgi:ethanolamine utilization cobalamin adenosyltransferase